MSKKSIESKKEFNEFTINNRLGNIDGFINLGYQQNSPPSNFNLNKQQILDSNIQSPSFNRVESGSAGQRFSNQFNLLEQYESQYVDLSTKLKPNSKKLFELKRKIDNLNDALKRPNEIKNVNTLFTIVTFV